MTDRGEIDPSAWDRLRRKMKRDGFSPIGDPDVERRNCKTQIIVERDGVLRERVHLQVADARHREELVCLHYLRHHARCFLAADHDGVLLQDVAVRFLSRDDPWDFQIALSTGAEFFLEITTVGDHRHQLEKEKREERMLLATGASTIRVRDLRKLASFFACRASDDALALHADTPADLVVANPFHGEGMRLVTGVARPPEKALAAQIVEAISRKAAKNHAGMDQTTVILDDRSNYARSDVMGAVVTELKGFLEDCPFPEIWLYVGYFSDDDGNNAEFSFSPLKLDGVKSQKLADLRSRRTIDEYGRMVW